MEEGKPLVALAQLRLPHPRHAAPAPPQQEQSTQEEVFALISSLLRLREQPQGEAVATSEAAVDLWQSPRQERPPMEEELAALATLVAVCLGSWLTEETPQLSLMQASTTSPTHSTPKALMEREERLVTIQQ